MDAWHIFKDSDGEKTRQLYAALESKGPLGVVALNLFRAKKASDRAKVYRGRGYKDAAYDKKEWSLNNLCAALRRAPEIPFGWKEDPEQPFHRWVLYVDLPTGQCSFHARNPLSEHRYPGEWDRSCLSAERIIRFCQSLLENTSP